ncbi:hypothetical protein HELRODRAFT_164454 [Helobdella robusta]|uniref:Endonuclease/exonuclease/phosphatase domain-containing protein n=1 Tax=Helobdella robusta TaxID=6412 RepID=T1EVF6_HELRO|nr:hypothetical protein HELRODRAFT_164454 [Helobdella robusta]ESN94589.1 hypothetical protein HELRODRAFT_164454 [Helobdella robusta]
MNNCRNLRYICDGCLSFVIKNRVMRSISKIKSLEGEFNKIKISHDLTRDQRVELRELIAEAKTKEANDGHFLYRVKGQLTNVVNEPTHNLGGTLDLVTSTPDIPLFNCRVDPSGVYSDHGLINVSFSVSIRLPLTTRRWYALETVWMHIVLNH